MIFCFDTSGLNYLHDDAEVEPIVTGLIATNTVWITALNVIEAGITECRDRRTSLLQLQKRLSGGIRPLEIPNRISHNKILAFATGLDRVDLSIGHDHNGIWIALNNPERIDEEMRQELYSWKKELEDVFATTHKSARAEIQELFTSKKEQRPRNATAFLRHYMRNDDLVFEVAAEIYNAVTGTKLHRDKLMSLFQAVPQLLFFLLGWAYAIYRRAILQHNYGSGNAGNIDIWCSIYLPSCDVFVTADEAQFKALRLINKFNQKSCKVYRYSELRKRLLVG